MTALMGELGGLVWTILAFVVALSIIVAIHEYGHYIIGRLSGIKAEVFSIGFGPRLLSRRDKRGTLWQVAAIPLGGYVRFLGDANSASAGIGDEVAPDQRRHTLAGAPLWARFATVAAGPVFNFILSIVVFAGISMWQGVATDQIVIGNLQPMPPGMVNELQPGDEIIAVDGVAIKDWKSFNKAHEKLPLAPVQEWTVRRNGAEQVVRGPDPLPPIVGGIAPRSAAASAGLKAGDVIVAVEGKPVTRFTEIGTALKAADGAPVVFRVWRDGVGEADYTLAANMRDTPTENGFEQRWMIGVVNGNFFIPATRSPNPIEAIGIGAERTWGVISSSVTGLWAMVTGQIGTCNLGGAISIAETTGQAASAGGMNFIWWIAVLSAAIGFLNLLPIPVLDGGHLMFFAYEGITGRPASDRAVNFLTLLGLAAVLSLMVFGLSNDLFCR